MTGEIVICPFSDRYPIMARTTVKNAVPPTISGTAYRKFDKWARNP
jgi:hypothetical protein